MTDRSARAALIFAAESADSGGGALRATLPFLGATLVEHQVRQAAAAGAAHVVVLVATMPAELLAALDRLRRDGLAVEVARNLADAADRLHPEEQVLLIADGCLAEQASLVRVTEAGAPALLVAAPADTPFERIDAAHGWAGLACVDGLLARRIATMPGEWDAQSVLLRHAVQAAAVRIEAGEAAPRLLREDAANEVPAERLSASAPTRGSWTSRWLFPLVEAPAVRFLAPRGVPPHGPAGIAAGLGVVAAALVALGWSGAGLCAFLLSGPVASTARRLARMRLGQVRFGRALERVRLAAGGVALLLVGLALGDPVWPVLAVLAIGAAGAAAREAAMLERRGGAVPPLLADADALGWSALAGVALAGWPGALVAAALYAVLSFAFVQDRLARAV